MNLLSQISYVSYNLQSFINISVGKENSIVASQHMAVKKVI